MRFPVLAVAATALSACGRVPTASTTAPPTATAAEFKVTRVGTRLENARTDGSGAAARRCGELSITFSFEEVAGVGARIVRQETFVTERDGGTQPGRTDDLDLPVPPSGRAAVTTVWEFCGQPAVDLPARLEVQFTIRDDRGNDLRVTNGAVLALL